MADGSATEVADALADPGLDCRYSNAPKKAGIRQRGFRDNREVNGGEIWASSFRT